MRDVSKEEQAAGNGHGEDPRQPSQQQATAGADRGADGELEQEGHGGVRDRPARERSRAQQG